MTAPLLPLSWVTIKQGIQFSALFGTSSLNTEVTESI